MGRKGLSASSGIAPSLGVAAALALAALLTPATARAECRADTVELRGDWGEARFTVEVADTPATRAQGLMHREAMPRGSGMLFVYEAETHASFWMRNTLIPLDMIFFDASGVATHVHHEAVPLDETPIDGGDGVLSVLEINGALAGQLGIGEGTEMRHPAMPQETAAWPCAGE